MRLALVAAVLLLATLAGPRPAAAQDADRPVVVELFTSQSCYSCPPAEAYLGELAARPDVVALEWHVDYWNDLWYGFAGRWADPFSDPAFTERQRRYNLEIRQIAQVYTPQMVIDGQWEAVGSRAAAVEALLATARGDAGTAQVAIAPAAGGGLTVQVDGPPPGPAAVWMVRFRPREVTDVERGENHGKTLTNHHIVTHLQRLGDWTGGAATFSAARDGDGEGCAVLVQEEGPGPVLAAAYCPQPPA